VPKRIRMSLLLCLAMILVAAEISCADSSAAPSLVYVSPLPGSVMHGPGTNVIARFDRVLDPASIESNLIEATGSLSGIHPGRAVLSNDRRTIVFRPDRPFTWGESVRVAVADPQAGAGALASTLLTFVFSIARAPSPPFDPMRMLERPTTESLSRAAIAQATADTLPADFPEIAANWSGTVAPGKLFAATFSFAPGAHPSYLLILDNLARPVFYRRASPQLLDFKLQPDGRLTYFDAFAGKFFAMDSSFTTIDSFACGNGYTTDLHELRLLPNGHALLLGLDPQAMDMSAIVPDGNPSATVLGMIIQELDADKNVVFEWRSWDHFAITDATHEDLTEDEIDYVHSNALELDADGNILLSSRHMDEITKIDRQTGATIWRWGGKHNQFTFSGDPIGFSHQHAIRRLANGHFTLFDNGNFRVPAASRAVEYELDETAHTARLVWHYRNTPDTYGSAMGYTERLPNGNTLISWGTGKPDLIEVAPDGTKVLELTLPQGLYSYRMSRSDWGPEDGTQGAPALGALSSGSPNPFQSSTRMTLDLVRPTRLAVNIYDARGRKVMTVLPPHAASAGPLTLDLDLSYLPAGVYLCRVDAGTRSEMRKLVRVP
jgi:hypothetical protein